MANELVIRLVIVGDVSEKQVSLVRERLSYWGYKVIQGSGTGELCDAIIVIGSEKYEIYNLTATVLNNEGRVIQSSEPEKLVIDLSNVLLEGLVKRHASNSKKEERDEK